ncbi:hypothetical protein [Providencia sp. PROV117]|uniref:hypothetical protein n=1 Tax=Providencia sp. PROV117 TaxID=2949828 RepID=UPI00234B8424|nr:hypothetical protein [Providencia sp. PROV117]
MALSNKGMDRQLDVFNNTEPFLPIFTYSLPFLFFDKQRFCYFDKKHDLLMFKKVGYKKNINKNKQQNKKQKEHTFIRRIHKTIFLTNNANW